MNILHFTGEGYGMMEGIEEYVVIVEDSENFEEHKAPNFILESVTEIADVPSSFPVGKNLVPQD